jgi:hypothetical protein
MLGGKFYLGDAISALNPLAEVSNDLQDDGSELWNTIVWNTPNTTNISEEEARQKVIEMQTEYDAKQYARDRAKTYPMTPEFIEAYTEKEIGGDSTKWDAYVVKYNKVRNDIPKP